MNKEYSQTRDNFGDHKNTDVEVTVWDSFEMEEFKFTTSKERLEEVVEMINSRPTTRVISIKQNEN